LTKTSIPCQSLSDSNNLADFNNVNKEFLPKNLPKKTSQKILPKNPPQKKSKKKIQKIPPEKSRKNP
jgi:hypothetical protein